MVEAKIVMGCKVCVNGQAAADALTWMTKIHGKVGADHQAVADEPSQPAKPDVAELPQISAIIWPLVSFRLATHM